MTYYVSSGTLNPTHSLSHSLVCLSVHLSVSCSLRYVCLFITLDISLLVVNKRHHNMTTSRRTYRAGRTSRRPAAAPIARM